MADYDLVVRGGTIVDGSGGAPFAGDIAIRGDRIVAVGDCPGTAAETVDGLPGNSEYSTSAP